MLRVSSWLRGFPAFFAAQRDPRSGISPLSHPPPPHPSLPLTLASHSSGLFSISLGLFKDRCSPLVFLSLSSALCFISPALSPPLSPRAVSLSIRRLRMKRPSLVFFSSQLLHSSTDSPSLFLFSLDLFSPPLLYSLSLPSVIVSVSLSLSLSLISPHLCASVLSLLHVFSFSLSLSLSLIFFSLLLYLSYHLLFYQSIYPILDFSFPHSPLHYSLSFFSPLPLILSPSRSYSPPLFSPLSSLSLSSLSSTLSSSHLSRLLSPSLLVFSLSPSLLPLISRLLNIQDLLSLLSPSYLSIYISIYYSCPNQSLFSLSLFFSFLSFSLLFPPSLLLFLLSSYSQPPAPLSPLSLSLTLFSRLSLSISHSSLTDSLSLSSLFLLSAPSHLLSCLASSLFHPLLLFLSVSLSDLSLLSLFIFSLHLHTVQKLLVPI
ncbi:hypothetical protein C7M84_015282 [Penaeus vannamei]|uniref:Uncharacterized protein n=1 Tax=Penaeus vannamei TaxID=6689 RepID=A0A3R7NTZ9_PENVA|nr:hypothetical protein C7M84_015282 [Penaeus vannamei]